MIRKTNAKSQNDEDTKVFFILLSATSILRVLVVQTLLELMLFAHWIVRPDTWEAISNLRN